MKRRLRWILAVMGAMALAAACGHGSGSANPTGEGETGGLRVNVLNMTEANVQAVRITITADGAVVGNRAVTQSDVTVARADGRVGGNPAVWEHVQQGIPVGFYKVQAFAYDVASPDPLNDTPTFTSVEVDVEVTNGGTAITNLFLRQNVTTDPDFNTPYITAVTLSNTPAFYETTEIEVVGAQGALGALNLHAMGDGEFDAQSGATWVAGTGDARTGATIDWQPADPTVPGSPEDQLVTVRLTDAAGNDTALKMTINVDHQRGEIDFTITFNEAPTIAVTTSIVNDEEESEVTMTATYTDPEYPAEDVTYTWDVSDCVTEGAAVSGALTGDIAGDGVADHTVTLTFDTSLEEHPMLITCQVIVTVEDQGVQDGSSNWVADSESSRTQVFNVTVGTGEP